jgi:3-deoxy-D-manno-octulosonate 8-phosphate phosphatase KdsC-like HAD superfamily phosphatase
VKQEAHWVTKNVGGSGAVRDAIELIFQAQEYWDEVLNHYEARRA